MTAKTTPAIIETGPEMAPPEQDNMADLAHQPHGSMLPSVGPGIKSMLKALGTPSDEVVVKTSRQVALNHGLEESAPPVPPRTKAPRRPGASLRAPAAKRKPDAPVTLAPSVGSDTGRPSPGVAAKKLNPSKTPKRDTVQAKSIVVTAKKSNPRRLPVRPKSPLNPNLEIPMPGEHIDSYIRIKIFVPFYVSEQLIDFCYQKRCTLTYALLAALKGYSENDAPVFYIRDEDCVRDRRKLPKTQS